MATIVVPLFQKERVLKTYGILDLQSLILSVNNVWTIEIPRELFLHLQEFKLFFVSTGVNRIHIHSSTAKCQPCEKGKTTQCVNKLNKTRNHRFHTIPL